MKSFFHLFFPFSVISISSLVKSILKTPWVALISNIMSSINSISTNLPIKPSIINRSPDPSGNDTRFIRSREFNSMLKERDRWAVEIM